MMTFYPATAAEGAVFLSKMRECGEVANLDARLWFRIVPPGVA